MFFLLNKEKIFAYMVSAITVVMLFFVADIMVKNENIVQTSSNTTSKELPIYNVKTNENKVSITMNCAWSGDDIDSILQTLKENNVNITFFVVGDWVDKYPEAVKKIYESGNEIGNHSNTHPHVNNLSLEQNKNEIVECSKKIENLTGSKVSLFRAPYGEYNNTVIQAAENLKYKVIQWNIDTIDYEGLTGEEMWNRINSKLEKGSIILTHNGTEHTADSLSMIIKNIKEKGYEIVKISDLIYKDNYTINNNGTQVKNE